MYSKKNPLWALWQTNGEKYPDINEEQRGIENLKNNLRLYMES